MTINIAIAVAEGLVMAADSMSQMQFGNQVIATHGSVEKLTEIGDVPIAAMTSGLGAIANRTILSLIREFEFNHYASPPSAAAFRALTVPQVANDLATFLDTRYTAQFPAGSPVAPALGIVVGGYSPKQFFPELFELRFPGMAVRLLHPQAGSIPGAGTINWSGVPVALNRLIKGVDLEALARARDLVNAAAQPGFVPIPGTPPLPAPTPADPVATAAHYEALIGMPHNLDGMPLEEAVEFADYLGMVAIGFDRFTVGAPAIGGELDVLAIQPEGLSWYRRKKFAAQMALARRR